MIKICFACSIACTEYDFMSYKEKLINFSII